MPGLADEVIHVPLNDFTIHNAQALAKVLASIAGTPGRSDRLQGSIEGDMAPDDTISYILSELWSKIVHPVLNALAITVSYLMNTSIPVVMISAESSTPGFRTYLVVSNWSTRISSHPCSRTLWK
jgi:hypothetical protein